MKNDVRPVTGMSTDTFSSGTRLSVFFPEMEWRSGVDHRTVLRAVKKKVKTRAGAETRYVTTQPFSVRVPDTVLRAGEHSVGVEAGKVSLREGDTGEVWLCVRRGFRNDASSGQTPIFGIPLTIDTDNQFRGSVTHDAFYLLCRSGILPSRARGPIDRLFRAMLREDGMSRFRSWYWFRMVRWFGRSAAKLYPVGDHRRYHG